MIQSPQHPGEFSMVGVKRIGNIMAMDHDR